MPRNFGFVIDRVLAGMARPGTFSTLREDLTFLREQGIGAIVSLTELPLDHALIAEMDCRYLHLSVLDFTPPSLDQVAEFMAFYTRARKDEVAVVVHCAAGRGRTGTLLACALVHGGMGAEEAINRVRQLRPASIETMAQEDRIRDYEKVARHKADGAEGS